MTLEEARAFLRDHCEVTTEISSGNTAGEVLQGDYLDVTTSIHTMKKNTPKALDALKVVFDAFRAEFGDDALREVTDD